MITAESKKIETFIRMFTVGDFRLAGFCFGFAGLYFSNFSRKKKFLYFQSQI